MHAPVLLLWRDVSVTAEYSPRSAINCKRNPWTVIPLSAWGPLTFLRAVLSFKLLPLPIFFVIVPCYLKHMVVEDSSILKPIRSAPPCHARHPISRCTQYRRFSENMSSFFEVTNPAFPCSLLHHELCFSHPAHPAGHKFSWQRSRTTSLSPAIPLPHQPPRPYLFLLPPPAFSASPVQHPSVILAPAALLLKSVFSPLMLTSPPKHFPCFIPFACHQPPPAPDFSQTFLALTGLTMEWNSCGMGRAKAPNSFSLFFFLPPFLRGKAANIISRTEWGWNCTGGTIRSSPESGGERVQAKANCPSPIVKWKNNRINYLPLWIQRFGKPVLAVYYHQSWNLKMYALWEIVKAGQQKGCRGCRKKDLKG